MTRMFSEPLAVRQGRLTLPLNRASAVAGGNTASRSVPVAFAWLIPAACSVLILLDTNWSGLIPSGSILRLLVPVFFLLILATAPLAARTHLENPISALLVAIVAIGAVSSWACLVPMLGLLKLALYGAVLVPALLCPRVFGCFAPNTRSLERVSLVCGGLLFLSVIGVGVFRNPNTLGALSLFTMPLMLANLHAKRPILWLGAHAGALLAGIACISSMSRGSLLGMLALIIVFLGLRHSPSVRSVITVSLITVGLGVPLILNNDDFQPYVNKGSETFLDIYRMNMMEESLDAFYERPWLGYGFGLSWNVKPEHQAAAFRTGRLSWFVGEFGNSTLAMLAGGGLLLAVAMYSLVGMVLLAGIRSLRTNGRRWPLRQYQLAMLAGIAGCCVQAQAEGWLMAPMNWPCVMFWLYCGAVLGVSTSPNCQLSWLNEADEETSASSSTEHMTRLRSDS